MDGSRTAVLAAIQSVGGGASVLARIEGETGPVETWWRGRSAGDLERASLPGRLRERLLDPRLDGQVASALERLTGLGFRVVEAAALAPLRSLPEPPLLLYVRGKMSPEGTPGLAVVGARRATTYGRRMARRLAGEVAAAGVSVVSGLARGIDGEAHAGALEVGGHTVAVLAAGPDRCYPPEHGELLERIGATGAILTEHLPGVPALPRHFPRRNRLMVALTSALLVIEARLRSGSLTSVRWAADLGRDVLVLPGPVDSVLSEGPVALLREGATPVATCEHVLEALGLESDPAQGAATVRSEDLSSAESRVLALLEGDDLDLDDLVRFSGEAPGRLLTLLLGLELRGLVARDEAMRYRARGATLVRSRSTRAADDSAATT